MNVYNRDELVNALRDLSNKAQAINEMATASVLLALCGALHAGMDNELSLACANHSRFALARIQELATIPEWPDVIG